MNCLTDMLAMVPPFIRDDPVMAAYYAAIAPDLQGIMALGESIPEQASPVTVTWGIDYLERFFGIVPNAGLTLEARRSALVAKLRGGPVSTPAKIRETAESYAGIGVDITEDCAGYAVDISILNYVGIPPYLDAMKAAIRAITPAHLALTYTIRWLLWDEFVAAGNTWAAVAAGTTWAQMKETGA